MQGGEFQVMRNQLPPRETITRGWQSLLLESLRRLMKAPTLPNRKRSAKNSVAKIASKQSLKKFAMQKMLNMC
ncbi:MAG: hypothetical protein R3C26_13615 [Calditrichia bacterium]